MSDPKFTKENVLSVSLAATSLLIWVLAIEKFAKVKKIVGPKEIALKEAEAKLKVKIEQNNMYLGVLMTQYVCNFC